MPDPRAAIVLAAGKGKRMKSDLPKVMHAIDGKSMISILMDTLVACKFDHIVVVVGYEGEMIAKELSRYDVKIAWQHEQLGTGHAVMMSREALGDFEGTTLVALGDVPFLSAGSIEKLLTTHQRKKAAATCLSAILEDATGYGRIIRTEGTDDLEAIVEHRDASADQLQIKEINTGTFCFDNRLLFESLKTIGNENAQSEYYLTETVKVLRNKGLTTAVVTASDPDEVRGINSVEQLEYLAQKFRPSPKK